MRVELSEMIDLTNQLIADSWYRIHEKITREAFSVDLERAILEEIHFLVTGNQSEGEESE